MEHAGMGRVATPVPPPIERSVLRGLAFELREEVRVRRRATLPPGELRPSARNTRLSLEDPLTLLLEQRERFGPVFTIRTMHVPVVWAIGATANHQVLVTDFDAFEWRSGRFADLWPLLGDGLLNVDGSYHREMRRLLLPAFHRDAVRAVTGQMVEEATAAVDRLRPGVPFDAYHWTRELALRIALRALLGITPGSGREQRLAHAFEQALGFHGRPYWAQMLRGPGTPYARAQEARRELDNLIGDEVGERRRRDELGAGALGMLLGATDADGAPLTVPAVRDQAVTLLFAGHDTTTATLTFLLHELAGGVGGHESRAALEAELDAALPGGAPPDPDQLDGTALPVLERTLQETLRRYPPAWVGPRRTVRDVTVDGVPVPEGVYLHYSSWVTHHLPELYPDPFRFDPDRFLPERAAALPKGAYVPFGGGSRMCLGKRFGEAELRALAAVLLGRFRVEPAPGAPPVKVVTTPTLGPRDGLRVVVRPR